MKKKLRDESKQFTGDWTIKQKRDKTIRQHAWQKAQEHPRNTTADGRNTPSLRQYRHLSASHVVECVSCSAPRLGLSALVFSDV